MLRDLQHGLRVLMKNPGFTMIAVVSIAIGVGANAAMFSVADGLVFRPLPVPRASEVVSILGQARDTGFGNRSLSYPDYADLRDRSKSFDNSSPIPSSITSFTNRANEPAQRKVGMAVSGNFFEAMEVRPPLGRAFRADEDEVPGRSPVVVLDYDEWRQQFAADPSIVNKRITLGGVEFTVIGVAPDGLHRHRPRREAVVLHPDRHVHVCADRRAAGPADASRRPHLHRQGPSRQRRDDEPGARGDAATRVEPRADLPGHEPQPRLDGEDGIRRVPRSARWRRHEYRRDADDAGAARPRHRVRQRRRTAGEPRPGARTRARAAPGRRSRPMACASPAA